MFSFQRIRGFGSENRLNRRIIVKVRSNASVFFFFLIIQIIKFNLRILEVESGSRSRWGWVIGYIKLILNFLKVSHS